MNISDSIRNNVERFDLQEANKALRRAFAELSVALLYMIGADQVKESDKPHAKVGDIIRYKPDVIAQEGINPAWDVEYTVVGVTDYTVRTTWPKAIEGLPGTEKPMSVPHGWYYIVRRAEEDKPEPSTSELVEMLAKREGVRWFTVENDSYVDIRPREIAIGEPLPPSIRVDAPACVLVVKE